MSIRNRITGEQCGECGRPLRNGVFCRDCRQALCSWICYIRHLKSHYHVQSTQPSPVEDDDGGLADGDANFGKSSSGPESIVWA